MNSDSSSSHRPLSVWDLPGSLLTSAHRFRKGRLKKCRERKHYPAILSFVYRNRFATTEQIRRRFPSILRSSRTARRHLAELHEGLGYLDIVPTPSPLWPKVFAVTRQGLRRLADALQKSQPSWEPPVEDRSRIGYSIHHVIHELFCTEFLLSIFESARASAEIDLLTVQRRSLAKSDAFFLSGKGRLIPDGMFLLRTKRGMICSFSEIDTGSMSMRAITEKLARYSAWAASDRGRNFITGLYQQHGAAEPQARFRIVFVCGGSNRVDADQRAKAVLTAAREQPGELAAWVWVTTSDSAREQRNTLVQEIWRSPRDTRRRTFFNVQAAT